MLAVLLHSGSRARFLAGRTLSAVLVWQETAVAGPAALQHATTVFHVLHGHEVHAKETLLKLLHLTVSTQAAAPALLLWQYHRIIR